MTKEQNYINPSFCFRDTWIKSGCLLYCEGFNLKEIIILGGVMKYSAHTTKKTQQQQKWRDTPYEQQQEVTVWMKEVSSSGRKRTGLSFTHRLRLAQPTPLHCERKKGQIRRRIISGDEKDPRWHGRTCCNQHQRFIKPTWLASIKY